MQGDREFVKAPDLKPYRPGLPFRLLREPLLHFFLLGAAIFGLFALVDDTPPPVAANVLEVTEDDARRLVAEFEATWRRPPTVAELDHMIGQLVREEVYVREALALGLDRDDAVIRRRLQTKMEFLTESGAEAVQPDDATLRGPSRGQPRPLRRATARGLRADPARRRDRAPRTPRARRGAAQPRRRSRATAARPTLLPPVFRPEPGAGGGRDLRHRVLRRAGRASRREPGRARSRPRSAAISSA